MSKSISPEEYMTWGKWMGDEEMSDYMPKHYAMSWTCHDGAIAKVIIPETADDDDLCAIIEFCEVVAKRHFKRCEEHE